jgi:hypothetical protein
LARDIPRAPIHILAFNNEPNIPLHIREQKKHRSFAREKFLRGSLQALKSHQVKTKVEP